MFGTEGICPKIYFDEQEAGETGAAGRQILPPNLPPPSNIISFPSWRCEKACQNQEICLNPDGCRFRRNQFNESDFNIDCPLKIQEVGSTNDLAGTTLTVNVGSLDRKVAIHLECLYAKNGDYIWRIEESDDVSVSRNINTVVNESKLIYELMKRDKKEWETFFSKPLVFQCTAKSVYSQFPHHKSTQVKVKGIRMINHGDSETFFCSSNSSQTYTWRVDGKKLDPQPEQRLGSAIIIFNTTRPKRVFVECEDPKGTILARYTMIICGREMLQQKLRQTAIYLVPTAFVLLCFCAIFLPLYQKQENIDQTLTITKKGTSNDNEVTNDKCPNDNSGKMSNLILLQLLVLPMYSSFSYILDVVTDYMAFFTYISTGNSNFGMATLALILLSGLVTSTIASINVFFDDEKSKTVFDQLTKSTIRRVITFIFMYCNFGPVLIQIQLFLTNLDILRTLQAGKLVAYELRRKREKIVMLLMKLAISELVCESLGQGILQAYILSNQLGREDICLPADRRLLSLNVQESLWKNSSDDKQKFYSYAKNTQTESSTRECDCSMWVAKGAEHCYPEEYLNDGINDNNDSVLKELNCFIADCTTNKKTFSIIFPFIQVISSILQISFAMTHLGAVNNLNHIASMKVTLKKVIFYVTTFFYFFMSLGVALILSTYLANIHNEGLYQLLAFLCILRLILPEATPARKYLSPWFIRILTILSPLIAHLPFYILLYNRLIPEDSGCQERARNSLTIHLRNNQTFERRIATFHATTPETGQILASQLSRMEFFPINIGDMLNLTREFRLPMETTEPVFSIRNSFNIFGHFFLWTGYLVLCDILSTIFFLLYWIFVVQSQKTVPTLDKLVDKMVADNGLSLVPALDKMTTDNGLSFVNADQPAMYSVTAGVLLHSLSVDSTG